MRWVQEAYAVSERTACDAGAAATAFARVGPDAGGLRVPAPARAPVQRRPACEPQARAPLLLLTGGEDHNVPALNTRKMHFALRRLGKPVEWVNYTNGGYGIPMTN